jgi:hypothetical protein
MKKVNQQVKRFSSPQARSADFGIVRQRAKRPRLRKNVMRIIRSFKRILRSKRKNVWRRKREL